MKKLNITKEGFEKSKYLQNKYGKLEYVSESGNLYKTETGNILKFKENVNPRNSLKLKGEMEEPIDDTDELGGEDEEQSTSHQGEKTNGVTKSKPRRFTCFDDLKKYIETTAYDKDVGAAIDGDGRLGSVADEGNIILWLNEIFDGTNVEIRKPKARNWADVEIVIDGSKVYYTNIKTTKGERYADNISSKKGVLYYLTGGKTEDFKTFLRAGSRFDFTEVGDETIDYFLLVMYKNTKEMLFTSLGRLQVLTPNFNNMPFQIPWNNPANKKPTTRSQIEQKQYIASVWYNSIAKGLKTIDYLKDLLGGLAGDFVQEQQ